MYLDWPIMPLSLISVGSWSSKIEQHSELQLWFITPYMVYMVSMFQKVANVCSRSTRSRQSNRVYAPMRDLCVSRSALHYNGSILYNTVNSKMQECEPLGALKYKVFKRFYVTTLRKDFVIVQLYWWLFSSTKHCGRNIV